MDEQTWLSCRSPMMMLNSLPTGSQDRKSNRKMRLFAVACCWRLERLLTDPRTRASIEIAERYADERASLADLGCAAEEADKACEAVIALPPSNQMKKTYPEYHITRAASSVVSPLNMFTAHHWARQALAWTAVPVARDRAQRDAVGLAELEVQAVLFRDVIGNPFRPLPQVEHRWLSWNDGTVVRIAESIYRDRRFDNLPVLADALVDAGCNAEDLLAHLGSPGPHCRGCWGLDLVLGKT